MAYTLPPLPFDTAALEPHIDAQTMAIHHDKHHAAYVTNLNAALEKAPELFGKSLDDLVANLNAVPEAIRAAVSKGRGGRVYAMIRPPREYWGRRRASGASTRSRRAGATG